ncbi:hypothetical protein LK542_11605 [Massilia sp. IC2-477]|uniref:hypothetical protein n=1 Tax=unclassified Massilia TaxID=2609279 RepID=UPI001D111C6B|nr:MULTISPECIES: hypothetical protein [unclassified Massilia]MCC2956261.1 hypothetical protein [Massilia sp. IC2-477]MCC2972368.1 hypothetical protein [Massilia sp. IC2-476]
MFNFLHPRPVVDGRAVAVKIVQQKGADRHDTRTLIVATPGADPINPPPADGHSEKVVGVNGATVVKSGV